MRKTVWLETCGGGETEGHDPRNELASVQPRRALGRGHPECREGSANIALSARVCSVNKHRWQESILGVLFVREQDVSVGQIVVSFKRKNLLVQDRTEVAYSKIYDHSLILRI